ncbi:MAG: archaetidylserine decarboxylase [Chloroflexota bacterium]
MSIQQNVYDWIARKGVALSEAKQIQNILSKLYSLMWRIPTPVTVQQSLLKNYIVHFNISLEESSLGIEDFKTLHDLFTRQFNPKYRPIHRDEQAIISPVDGTIQNQGTIADGRLIQAKGIRYSLSQLIPSPLHAKFQDGQFLTIYLSPGDAHQLFSPVDGDIVGYTYVPGSLFSLSERYVNQIHGLYTLNERLITYIETAYGWVAVVKIGAFGVGSITTTYDATIRTNRWFRKPKEMIYASPISIARGDHLATFHIGSTVVLLFQKERVRFSEAFKGGKIKYGQRIGLSQKGFIHTL